MGQRRPTNNVKALQGPEYTLCDLAVKCTDAFVPLFYHGFTPRHCLGFERAVAGDAYKGHRRPVLPQDQRPYCCRQLAAGEEAIAPRIKGMLLHFEMQP